MIGSIAFINIPTYRAGLAGVFRVNEYDRHTGQLSFVKDKGRQLTKGPVMQSCSLLTSNSYPLRNSLEHFKGNAASGAFRFLHDCFADLVINVRLITRLVISNCLEFALGSTRAFALKISAAVRKLATTLFNLFAAECLAIGIGCNIDNTQVYTKKILNVLGLWRFNFARDEKVKLAIYVTQIGLAAFAFQQFMLAFTAQIRHVLASIKSPDTNFFGGSLEIEDAAVVGKRAMRVKVAPTLLVDFVGIRNFSDSPDSHLRGKSESLTNVVVDKLMQVVLSKRLAIPCLFAGIVAGGIGFLQSLEQPIELIWRRLQFDLRSKSHNIEIKPQIRRQGAFLPPLSQDTGTGEAGGLLRRFL